MFPAIWVWSAACRPDEPARPTSDTEVDLPPLPSAGVPAVVPDPATDEGGLGPCADTGWILTTFTGPASSGVLILDLLGAVRWAWVVADPDDRVLRARPARDGQGLWIAVGDRVVDNGDQGVILRVGVDGATLSSTPTRDPHHDFVELPDGRLAWLGYEFSQPSDGATQQYLATDRIWATPEGGGASEILFSTLGDFSFLGRTEVPDEGLDGRTIPGFEVWGQGASLGYRESDDALFLMWRWQDTLLALDGGGAGVRWAWGGDWSDLAGGPSFERAHFSDVWDGGLLVFDNRREGSGPSRLVEYAFDDASYDEVWSWSDGEWEGQVGDVSRVPGCDHVLAVLPSRSRLAELGPGGEVAWAVTVDAAIERGAFLAELPW
jgi:hypothetical protein